MADLRNRAALSLAAARTTQIKDQALVPWDHATPIELDGDRPLEAL